VDQNQRGVVGGKVRLQNHTVELWMMALKGEIIDFQWKAK